MFKYLTVFFICAIPAATFATSSLQPTRLSCEYLVNPLGIDVASPRLSWIFSNNGRNQYQSAYELIVSDNLKDVQQNEGNIWSTGKVTSKQNIQVEYAGAALQSFKRYYWRVKTYDQNNEASEWSQVNWFETAMLNQTDWKAQWISDGSRNPERDEDYYKDDRMPLFRKEFSTNKKIAAARLYISGLGYYEAYLNGNKIGNNMLDPGFTTYKKEVLYTTYDITSMLKKGSNVAGVMLGSGWWNPLPVKLFGRWDLRQYQQSGRPCVKAEMHIQYDDGSTVVIATDESWQTAPGPIVFNNVYLGEKYDARLEQKNWNNINADKSIWKQALLTQGPSDALS